MKSSTASRERLRLNLSAMPCWLLRNCAAARHANSPMSTIRCRPYLFTIPYGCAGFFIALRPATVYSFTKPVTPQPSHHARTASTLKPNRDRGRPHDLSPPTPPYIRITNTAVRSLPHARTCQGVGVWLPTAAYRPVGPTAVLATPSYPVRPFRPSLRSRRSYALC
jgi:hypothetical protein